MNRRPRAAWLTALVLWPLALRAEIACEPGPGCSAVSLAAAYTGDVHRNARGGLREGTALSHMLELGALWHAATPGGFGITTNAAVMYIGGGEITADYVGDLQGLNNIEASNGWRLYEFWTEMRFGAGGGAGLRAGWLDLNAEFDTPVTSALFVGPPHGIGTELAQSGRNGPAIWPSTGLGVRIAGSVSESLQWRIGAYEGVPGVEDRAPFARFRLHDGEGVLLIGEVETASWGSNALKFGAWRYTAKFERIDATAGATHVNQGAYALLDMPLGAINALRFDGALRVGVADPHVNTFGSYAGLSLVASRVSSDDAMAVGIAVAHARPGSAWRAAQQLNGAAATSETSVELSVRYPLGDYLTLLPHVQYVSHPGALRQTPSAWVAGMRFELSGGRHWPLMARQQRDPSARTVQNTETN
jgi:porin